MNEKLNLAEILKDCPKGMELDCTVYNDVTFLRVDDVQNRCYFKAGPADTFWTTCEGRINGSPYGKCVVFPKGKTTWEGFKPKKPKFDPKTLMPFDRVLVKCLNNSEWLCNIFTKPAYRPFRNREECWNEMLKHQPFGWVKAIESGDYYEISGVHEDTDFEHYAGRHTFADGTPFGIKED